VRRLIDDLVSGLIEGTVSAAHEADVRDVEDVRTHPVRIARFSSGTKATSRELKRFLFENVYSSAELAQGREASMARLRWVFDQLLARGDQPRAACDFIAGMTDRYFLRFYASLKPQESVSSDEP
jgi:dGTPase